ncbi:MAG: hypothetical protein QOJ41_1305 [Acidobacteriaceae bacterium]|jgi:hypothetical protein|nr:hypothetical protein [Acidobacteriaceae bacterium]
MNRNKFHKRVALGRTRMTQQRMALSAVLTTRFCLN